MPAGKQWIPQLCAPQTDTATCRSHDVLPQKERHGTMNDPCCTSADLHLESVGAITQSGAKGGYADPADDHHKIAAMPARVISRRHQPPHKQLCPPRHNTLMLAQRYSSSTVLCRRHLLGCLCTHANAHRQTQRHRPPPPPPPTYTHTHTPRGLKAKPKSLHAHHGDLQFVIVDLN